MMVNEALMWNMQWLSRVAVALGGFLIFVGIMMIGIFVLVFFSVVNPSMFESDQIRMLSLGAMLAIGVLDLVSGIIIRRR